MKLLTGKHMNDIYECSNTRISETARATKLKFVGLGQVNPN